MANAHGDWIWYELMTGDAEAAQSFYGKLLGWTFKASAPGSAMDYREIVAGTGEHVGGLLSLTSEMRDQGARPCWLGYVAVDDVDATVTAAEKAGGTVLMPARDLEDVGRFAFVTDPQGVPFHVMRGSVKGYTSNAFSSGRDRPRSGHCSWNELVTTDQKGAIAFYASLFGWSEDGAFDMGPMGSYIFLRNATGVMGAAMPKPPMVPASGWNFYFRVDDIAVAEKTVRENGGAITNGPHPVPGDDMILQGLDPQGAPFSLVARIKA